MSGSSGYLSPLWWVARRSVRMLTCLAIAVLALSAGSAGAIGSADQLYRSLGKAFPTHAAALPPSAAGERERLAWSAVEAARAAARTLRAETIAADGEAWRLRRWRPQATDPTGTGVGASVAIGTGAAAAAGGRPAGEARSTGWQPA